jgi:hypoxanthine phosphoribosyltransferase
VKVVFSEEQIRGRVRAMAEDISRDHGNEVVHAVGILENGFIFLSDLVRALRCPVVCHFMAMEAAESKEPGHQAHQNIAYGPIGNIAGKNILLVDAVVDSGITLDHLIQILLSHQPKSLRTAVLVDREDRRRVDCRVDYAGFQWTGNRLVGYGLEQDGLYRNLPYVAEVPAEASN